MKLQKTNNAYWSQCQGISLESLCNPLLDVVLHSAGGWASDAPME
ncbi:hypothetical protein [Sulfuracidifex metallicus]|nr:hypothetical protein [Sulfuracidifex metallicus]MCY0851076.1 hypothetical protein [Sulfuracidifex metallicus]